jgi:signal transduction histidine kinase
LRALFRWLSPFYVTRRLYRWTMTVVRRAVEHFRRSLRLQLITTFVFCLLAALLAASLAHEMTEKLYLRPYVDYSQSMERMDWDTRRLASIIREQKVTDKAALQQMMNNFEQDVGLRMLLVNLDGKVVLKSAKATESQVDLYSVISRAMELRLDRDRYRPQEFVAFYPVELAGQKGYLIARGMPEASIRYESTGVNMIALPVFLIVLFYLFYRFTKRKTGYIEELADSLLVISQGKLDHRVEVRGEDELGSLARNINRMAEELQANIERERQAEKTKNELITNVSHDLRTPLTSVLGYLRLLKDHPAGGPDQQEYTRIAYEKAEHLKRLVEDLFEYTTLSSQGVQLYRQTISMNELVEQLVEEYVPLAEEQQLSFCKALPDERLYVSVDPEKFVRVLENLFSNAIKYGKKPGSIDVTLAREAGGIRLSVANRADEMAPEALNRLFERFYRVEQSRSRKTGGSGLGLAIVKSIVELHGGRIQADYRDGVLSFHIWLPAPRS